MIFPIFAIDESQTEISKPNRMSEREDRLRVCNHHWFNTYYKKFKMPQYLVGFIV